MATTSAMLPHRPVRLPALQRQCVFLRPQYQLLHRAFSCTPTRLRARQSSGGGGRGRGGSSTLIRAAAKTQLTPSPRVGLEKMQREAGGMEEDIGILQHTIVRAPFKDLPALWRLGFWSYIWTLLKSKATAMYSRIQYQRCSHKVRLSRFYPVGIGNNEQLRYQAETLYKLIYSKFAKGDLKPLKERCLSPFFNKLEKRITARGGMEMEWEPTGKISARVVSHRASLLGEDNPNSAIRQAVVRIECQQSVTITKKAVSVRESVDTKGPRPAWVPENASKEDILEGGNSPQRFQKEEDRSSTETERVVEYLVLQQRVLNMRQEQEWKVWGFTRASTPESIASDEDYWRKTLAYQTALGAS